MDITACEAELKDKDLKIYKQDMSKECIAMILGAGCSADAYKNVALPQWSELLKKMSEGQGSSVSAPPPELYLDVAGKIEKGMQEDFSKRLKNSWSEMGYVLPDEVIEASAGKTAAINMAEYVKLILGRTIFSKGEPELADDGTLKSVIDVCEYRVKHRQKTIIILYNYDDSFEFALSERGISVSQDTVHVYVYDDGKSDLQAITHAMMNCQEGVIELFYVHGRIPLLLREESEGQHRIILSNQGYEELSLNRMSAINQVQYIALSSLPCVAIGFSCSDSNFKRLRKDLKMVNMDPPPLYLLKYCPGDCAHCDSQKKEEMKSECDVLIYQGIKAFAVNSKDYSRRIKEMSGA